MPPSTSPSLSLPAAWPRPRSLSALPVRSMMLCLVATFVAVFVAVTPLVAALSTGTDTGGGGSGGVSSTATILAPSSTAAAAAGDASSSSGSVPSAPSSSAAATAAPMAVSSSGSATAASFVSSSSSAGIAPVPAAASSSSSSSSGSNAPAAGPVVDLSPFVKLAAPSTWAARLDFGSAQCGNRTLLFGGRVPNLDQLHEVSFNDVHSTVQGPSGLQWMQLPDAPWAARWGSSVIALNATRVLMIAGGTNSVNYPEVWAVDCAEDDAPPRWTALQLGITAWPERKMAAAVLWRGELVLMGGSGSRVVTLRDVYSMSLQSLSWTTRPEAAWSARFLLQAAVLDDQLFVFGGNQNPGYLNDVWRLTSWDSEWIQLANAPFSQRLYMSSIVLSSATMFGSWDRSAAADAPSGSVWLLSGGSDYSHPVSWNQVYSFDGAAWTREIDAAWPGRYGAQMLPSHNSTLTLIGGQTEDGGFNDTWVARYSVSGGGNQPIVVSSSTGINPPPQPSFVSSSTGSAPAPPAPFVPPSAGPALDLLSEFVQLPSAASWASRSGFGAVLCGSNVLVLGGFALTSPYWLNEVHALSLAAGSWSQLASAPWSGRDQFAVSRLNSSAILLTGGAAESGPSNDVWSARCTADGSADPQWSLLSASAAFPPRFAHATVVWGTQLVLLGGSASGTLAGLNDVWTLDLSAGVSAASQWVARPLAPWSSRQSFAAAVLGSALFVSGGVTVSPPFTPAYLNDVWMLTTAAAAAAAGSDRWASAEWTQLAPAPFSPRAYLASATLNGTAWFVCGGQSVNGTVTADPEFRFNGSWVAQPTTPEWALRQGARMVDLSEAARSASAGSSSPLALLLIGGSNAASVPLNDVWAAYIGAAPAAPASSDSPSSAFRWSSAGGVIAILLIIGVILAVPVIGLYCWRKRVASQAHSGYTRDYSQSDHSLDAPILTGAKHSQIVY